VASPPDRLASLEGPFVLRKLNPNRPPLIKADPSCVKDRGSQHRVRDGRQLVFIVVRGLQRSSIDVARSVDELFDGDVAVAALAVEVPGLRRGILHAGVDES